MATKNKTNNKAGNIPKWSVSKQKFIDADKDYIEAMEDVVDELKSFGNNIKALKEWMENNNADFELEEKDINNFMYKKLMED